MSDKLDPNKIARLADTLRVSVLEMLIETGNGHAAGPLGLADIFAYMYGYFLKHPADRSAVKTNRVTAGDADYVLVSNGHVCPIWYAALAEADYFPKEELLSLRKLGSRLQGHPKNSETPGVFNSSGPLGHGQGQAIGAALGLKLDEKPNQVYCVVSDGEHQEGAHWEALLTAGKYKLNNLTLIMDDNNVQIDGFVENIMPLPDIAETYKQFGWEVISISGHDIHEIHSAFTRSRSSTRTKPLLIQAINTPGKGVSEMEGKYKYHDWRGDANLAHRGIAEINSKYEV